MIHKNKKWFILGLVLIGLAFCFINVSANSSISLDFDNTGNASLDSLDVVFLLLFLSIIPSLLLMMTSFTRIIIVFSFLRNALGLQQSPPNQILVGLSLFLRLQTLAKRTAEMHIALGGDIHETAFTPTTYNGDYTVWLKNRMLYQFQNRLNLIENS